MNLVLATDSYKLTHWKQDPAKTTKKISYMESRGGLYPATIFCMLQYYTKKYLSKPITQMDIDQAHNFCDQHIGPGIFNREGWQHILDVHKGYLPLEIKAVPEGTLVPTGNVLMTIENTDDKCAWLTNHVETLLMKLWAPITVATNSFYCKKRLVQGAIKTGSPVEAVNFKLHDFGYRGVSSEESAAILGAATAINFWGGDTIAAALMLHEFYDANEMPLFSVPASEHSTATPFGKGPGEKEYLLNMLKQYPTGIVSCIMDSYNVYDLCEQIGTDPELKEAIMTREGVFVARLDSGDPVEVVSRCLDILWRNFGGTYTDNHYQLLDKHIRILQGDGIDAKMIDSIITMMENTKWATDNIVFGSGGGLLQKFDRDTQKFAIKCSLAIIDGKEVNVQKDPITSAGKKSKAGRLKLHPDHDGSFTTISSANETPEQFNAYVDTLQLVYKDGGLFNQETFKQIRDRANSYLTK